MDQERLNDAMQKEEPAECRKAKPFWKNYRGIALLVAFVLLFTAIGGYTVAYLQMAKENAVKNDFRLAGLDVVRSNDTAAISFTNNGDVAVYIRVAVIGNWAKGGDKITDIYAASRPTRGTDYYLQYTKNKGTASEAVYKDAVGSYIGYNADAWFKVEENGVTYYYHKAPVKPKTFPTENVTSALCEKYVVSNTNAPEGYSCAVEFAVQAIQAVGAYKNDKGETIRPVTEAWGISVGDGGILQNPAG